jgi:hypothetical protein
MPARGAAEVGVGVSLGLIHHRQDVRLGLLLLRACPQAIQTVDEAMSALHNNASSVEGCLDILRSLARDPVHLLPKSVSSDRVEYTYQGTYFWGFFFSFFAAPTAAVICFLWSSPSQKGSACERRGSGNSATASFSAIPTPNARFAFQFCLPEYVCQ